MGAEVLLTPGDPAPHHHRCTWVCQGTKKWTSWRGMGQEEEQQNLWAGLVLGERKETKNGCQTVVGGG